jgi:hypothetical protein
MDDDSKDLTYMGFEGQQAFLHFANKTKKKATL